MTQICTVKIDGAKLYARPKWSNRNRDPRNSNKKYPAPPAIADVSAGGSVTKLDDAEIPVAKEGEKPRVVPGWWRVSAMAGGAPTEGYMFSRHLKPAAAPSMFPFLDNPMDAFGRVVSFVGAAPALSSFKIDATFLPKFNDVLAGYGITENAQRFAHFMAQIAHESGGFRMLGENLNYSEAGFVEKFWERFGSKEDPKAKRKSMAAAFIRDINAKRKRGELTREQRLQAIANRAYGNRADLGNGDEASGDGWRYRGRGFIQLTGRANYKDVGERIGVDLLNNPDILLTDPVIALKASAAFWAQKNLNELADLDDLAGITGVVNGGVNGLEDRGGYLKKAKLIWTRMNNA